MLKIAICDDSKDDLKTTYKIVEKYFSATDIEFNIDVFQEPLELIQKSKEFNLIFLDIELGNENGLKIAKEINQINKNYKLILISNYCEYLQDGYRVKADRYFVKPINQSEFNMDMDDVLKDYINANAYIFDTKVCKSKIYIKDILYIERLSRKTYLYTKKETYVVNYTLLYWKELLNDYKFVQCHKSFYVNMYNIKDYDHNNIYIWENGNEYIVPISRFYKDEFIKKYTYYISENM